MCFDTWSCTFRRVLPYQGSCIRSQMNIFPVEESFWVISQTFFGRESLIPWNHVPAAHQNWRPWLNVVLHSQPHTAFPFHRTRGHTYRKRPSSLVLSSRFSNSHRCSLNCWRKAKWRLSVYSDLSTSTDILKWISVKLCCNVICNLISLVTGDSRFTLTCVCSTSLFFFEVLDNFWNANFCVFVPFRWAFEFIKKFRPKNNLLALRLVFSFRNIKYWKF